LRNRWAILLRPVPSWITDMTFMNWSDGIIYQQIQGYDHFQETWRLLVLVLPLYNQHSRYPLKNINYSTA
jgi:hypothetical protein